MTLQFRIHAIFAFVALVCVPFTAWSRDISVVVLAFATLAILCDPDARHALAEHTFLQKRGTQIGLALVAWGTAAVFWSPHNAWGAWARACPLVIFTIIVVVGLQAISADRLRRFAPFVTAACGGLLLLLLIERLTGGFFIHIDRSTAAPDTLYNVLSGGLVLLCCLAFCAGYFLWRKTSRRSFAVAFVVACFGVSLFYRMDAAPIALALGAVCFLLVRRFGAGMFAFLGIWLVIVTLAWGSLASMAWTFGADGWLREHGLNNWAARIGIWRAVAQLIAENSVVGYGFDSARTVGQGLVPFLHPHNGVLQVWLELGLIGTLLMYAAIARAAKILVQNMPSKTVLAVAAATIVTFAVFWSISFGIWQGWYMAVAGLIAAALALLYRVEDQSAA